MKLPIKISIVILIWVSSLDIQAQYTSTLAYFEKFNGSTWIIDAKWVKSGSPLYHKVTYKYAVEKSILTSETKKLISLENKFQDKSIGIKQYDWDSQKILLWEFDKAGVTKGEVRLIGKNIMEIYSLGSDTYAEILEYQDEDTFSLRIVEFNNNQIGDLLIKGKAYRTK